MGCCTLVMTQTANAIALRIPHTRSPAPPGPHSDAPPGWRHAQQVGAPGDFRRRHLGEWEAVLAHHGLLRDRHAVLVPHGLPTVLPSLSPCRARCVTSCGSQGWIWVAIRAAAMRGVGASCRGLSHHLNCTSLPCVQVYAPTFSDRAATVACKQLSLPTPGRALTPAPGRSLGGAFFGEGTGPVWLQNVQCTGKEALGSHVAGCTACLPALRMQPACRGCGCR